MPPGCVAAQLALGKAYNGGCTEQPPLPELQDLETGSPWRQLDGGCWCNKSPVSWQECGPLESEAMVMGVLNEAFDVLVLKFGVQKRIYCNVSTSRV